MNTSFKRESIVGKSAIETFNFNSIKRNMKPVHIRSPKEFPHANSISYPNDRFTSTF